MKRRRILFAITVLLSAAGVVAGLVVLAVVPADFEEDFTPPMIADVSANSITHNSAVITWATDEPAASKVGYSFEHARIGLVEGGVRRDALATSHVIPLDFLQPDTAQTYRVSSVDSAGNEAVSDEYTFTTLPSP